jgi:hypothetical protein
VLGLAVSVGGSDGLREFALKCIGSPFSGLWSSWLSDRSLKVFKINIAYLVAAKNCYSFLWMEIDLLFVVMRMTLIQFHSTLRTKIASPTILSTKCHIISFYLLLQYFKLPASSIVDP